MKWWKARNKMPIGPETKILVRGVNWLGDAVMSVPALLRLREAHPEAHISLSTREELADLWRNHPALNQVLTFSKREFLWRTTRRLRAERFDISLILPNSPRSALESFLARIPRRIGYRGNWRRRFLTDPVPAREGAVKMRKRSAPEIQDLIRAEGREEEGYTERSHHIHDYLHLARVLGGRDEPLEPVIPIGEAELVEAMRQFGLRRERPLFGLNPGAEYGPAKRWPIERFVELAIQVQKRTRCAWLIFGGTTDIPVAAELARRIQRSFGRPELWGQTQHSAVRNLAGHTTLRQLCVLLKACEVVVTNDTGPMHVSAAVGTPVVALFGSTAPELTGPGLPGNGRHRVLRSNAPCAPCFLRRCPIDFRCMRGITVERVMEAVLALAPAGETRSGAEESGGATWNEQGYGI